MSWNVSKRSLIEVPLIENILECKRIGAGMAGLDQNMKAPQNFPTVIIPNSSTFNYERIPPEALLRGPLIWTWLTY